VAKLARPPAKIGAIVESAQAARKRLAPMAAKPIDAAAKAINPVVGGKPARCAVAICDGRATAASASPAARSRRKSPAA
jgi:hypothetical protein